MKAINKDDIPVLWMERATVAMEKRERCFTTALTGQGPLLKDTMN